MRKQLTEKEMEKRFGKFLKFTMGGVGTIIAGLIFIVAGIAFLKNGTGKQKRCIQETTGIVVEIKEEKRTKTDKSGSIYHEYIYYPVIEYKAGDKTVRKISNEITTYPRYKVNDKVDILYNPDNIEEYIMKGTKPSYALTAVFEVFGILFLIIGLQLYSCARATEKELNR